MTATRSRAARAVHTATRDDPRPDSELLAQFVTHHDAAAFAAVVHRHGPLVYGVCRRTLGATADADDAFQAAFLVLAQKAGAIPWRGGLGPWLFGVAHRIARKARFRRDRRFAVEKQVDAMPHPETFPPDPIESDELSRAFDEELAALPEDMRRAVVLCELQGRSRQQAAKELRVGEGTLSSRLARARKLLRDRLAKRGFGLVIPATVMIPAKLTAATVGLVNGSAGVVPAAVAALTQEAVKAMTISKLKLGAVLAAVAVGVSGYGLAVGGDDIKPPAKADPQVKQAAKVEPPAADKPKGRLELSLSLKSGSDAVATVGGQDVSRAEFADYLIRKHGAKEIEGFVNKKIIEAEAKKRGVTVTDEEVELAFLRAIDQLKMTKADFVRTMLPKAGKTEAEWRDDILRQQLLLEKLSQGTAEAATDFDARNLFEQKYGERRRVQLIQWASEEQAREMHPRVKKEPLLFEQYAVRVQQPNKPEERHVTFDKGPNAYGGNPVKVAVFNLKVDEVSELVPLEKGWCTLRLVEIVPPATDKKYDDEKPALLEEANKMRLQMAIPKRFEELKKDAKPVYHIQPEPKTYPQPLPAKK